MQGNHVKPERPDWYQEHINKKKIALTEDLKIELPIRIHPLLMLDKDGAIAEYDRLYNILAEPYKLRYRYAIETEDLKLHSKEVADKFICEIISMYMDLWLDVREYNDIDVRSACADDSKQLTHYVNIVDRAEEIQINFDEDGRMSVVFVKDDNGHRVSLSRGYSSDMQMGVNDNILNDITTGLGTILSVDGVDNITLGKKNKRWCDIKDILKDAVSNRVFYDPDVRSLTSEISLKCKPLYAFIVKNRVLFGIEEKERRYSHKVGEIVKDILSLKIDTRRMVGKIQGKN